MDGGEEETRGRVRPSVRVGHPSDTTPRKRGMVHSLMEADVSFLSLSLMMMTVVAALIGRRGSRFNYTLAHCHFASGVHQPLLQICSFHFSTQEGKILQRF